MKTEIELFSIDAYTLLLFLHKITGCFVDPFHGCSTDVDPAPFIKQCEHDVCECGTSAVDVTGCECAAFARYARECQMKEATFDWRFNDVCCE